MARGGSGEGAEGLELGRGGIRAVEEEDSGRGRGGGGRGRVLGRGGSRWGGWGGGQWGGAGGGGWVMGEREMGSGEQTKMIFGKVWEWVCLVWKMSGDLGGVFWSYLEAPNSYINKNV